MKDRETERAVPKVFECGLELISLDKFKARFRVINPEGWSVDFHHLDVARNQFPMGENFNMDFINADIDAGVVGDPGEPIDEKAVKDQKKAMKALQKKYADLTRYVLTITNP